MLKSKIKSVRRERKKVSAFSPQPSAFVCSAFTLVEVLVVVVLMSFIVLALMAVFNGTQTAFRASLTQSDVLEGGRSVMGMIKNDLEGMTPSDGISIVTPGNNYLDGPVNFAVYIYDTFTINPLVQSLTGSGNQRTNVQEWFFILTRQNTTWTGVGYKVDLNSSNYFFPLYRYSMSTNVSAPYGPKGLFADFGATPTYFTNNISHLIDGVVDLRVRAYDPQGRWINGTWTNAAAGSHNILPAVYPTFGEPAPLYMLSNALPASVEIELGVLEDRVIQRAESISDPTVRSNYLAQQAGQVHVFRQRVWIRNVDPSAYQ